MSETSKITASHRARAAVIYVRQSTLAQLERNTESTARQYDLVTRAVALGWPPTAVRVIDADLGVSGSVTGRRDGFEGLVAEVALGQVGIILALEASRLARDNAAWYRLLDLAGMCDTLVADADGVYHPGLFNDRLVLGMKGLMSEAELHVLRARLDGGVRNKAARGQLRRGLPVGLVWGEADGQVCLHPDEAVTGVIAAVFERFAVCGSARATWLWLREQGLHWPLQRVAYRRGGGLPEITWVEPTYHAVHTTLTHPAYAGAYVYGRTHHERYLSQDGTLRERRRRLPRDQWEVLITDHHPGFIDWDTYQANQQRIGQNIRPQAHQPGTGAVREGCALLQGLATCGECGRKLAVFYQGPAKSVPNYYCQGADVLVDGRGARHLNVGGLAIDAAVAEAFLAALQPAALTACLAAAQALQDGHDAALEQWRRQVEQARYAATRAERRYRAVDPDTGWSPAAWKPSGTPRWAPWPTPKPSWPAAKPPGPWSSPTMSAPRSLLSATTSARSGQRPRPPTATASNCCAPCLRRSTSPCAATPPNPTPTWCCAGGAARSARCGCRCVAPSPRSAPTRTPST
jgi:DNA invertase Pin-like site-specific DNA recombinase